MKKWTSSQLRSFIRESLRKIWFRHPSHLQAREDAVTRREPWLKKDGTQRMRKGKPLFLKFFQCASCKEEFKGTLVQVDHIDPVGPAPGSRNADDKSSWDEVISRMLEVEPEDLQVLCTECHNKKTETDRQRIKDGTWRNKDNV